MDLYNLIKRFFGLEKETGCIEERIENIEKDIKHLYHTINKRHSPRLIFTTIINNHQIKILKIMPTLDSKQFVEEILALENTDTKAAISATFANVKLLSSDVSIFTCDTDVNADGTLDIVGIAPGTATLTVTADATYTDANTGQPVTASKSATVDVTVNKPLPGAENTDLVVTFSDPKAV